jgi:hypothetical protein
MWVVKSNADNCRNVNPACRPLEDEVSGGRYGMKKNIFGWNRRLFVGGAASTMIASLYAAAVGRGALKACNYADVEAGLPLDFQSLIRIGNSYLNEHIKNGKPDIPDKLLFDETETRSTVIAYAVQRHLLAMDAQVRDEFARSETVICDGWVLAKSEAQLCATIAAHVKRL